ncbi:MAG TPA: pyridoxal phosphate-dependent aminotransferase [Blastocatellia bacterium]|jgi:aspartate aminotransferase|nr:pyridoxal phosphate-dependent aminotransferase [Blastocatellia bacterium]
MAREKVSEAAYRESVSVSDMKVSSTLSVLMESERLKAQGIEVIDLGAGEPDFPTPRNVKEAAQRAIEENFTRYTSTGGIAPLKEAIIRMLDRDFGASYECPELIVTVGGKQGIFNAMATLLNPGDDVLVPSPYWVTFPEIVTFLRANSVFIDTEPNGFLLTAEMVRDSITPRTRLLIINSPNNPTGRVIDPEEFRKIVEVAAEHDVWVISDECYLYFAHPPAQKFTAGQLPAELRSRVMISGSFSKSHAMTGWRIGYALGPEEWIHAMLKLQSHSTSNATSISQKAAIEAATGPQEPLHAMLEEYRERRDWLVPALNAIEGVECSMPEGAFYVMPNMKGLLGGRVKTSSQLARVLLTEAQVVVTPGSAFGLEGYLRVSYANSLDAIKRAVERLAALAPSLR